MMTAPELERLIRRHCRACWGGSLSAAKKCDQKKCDLWPVLHRARVKKADRLANGEQLGISVPHGATVWIGVTTHDEG